MITIGLCLAAVAVVTLSFESIGAALVLASLAGLLIHFA